MANFCINCGTKIRKEDTFCTNCGTKISKSDIKPNNQLLKSTLESIEKKKYIITKENEEKRKILKTIDELFESEEIKSEIRKNKIDKITEVSLKYNIKNKLINKKEKMIKGEIKYFIKTELEKAKITIEKEINNKKTEENERLQGGYCGLSCIHYYEEFLDSGGGIVGNLDSEGYVEYYCRLGYDIAHGSYCEDYK